MSLMSKPVATVARKNFLRGQELLALALDCHRLTGPVIYISSVDRGLELLELI